VENRIIVAIKYGIFAVNTYAIDNILILYVISSVRTNEVNNNIKIDEHNASNPDSADFWRA